MSTFLNLQDRVKARVIDLPTAVQNEVPDLINEAIRELEDSHNFHVMRATADFTTNTGASDNGRVLGPAPSNFKELRGRPWYTTEKGDVRDIAVSQNRNMAEQAFGVDATFHTGAPKAILHAEEDETGQADFEVFPLPDGNSDYSDGEYRITIPYWRRLTDLSADADTNWFTVNAKTYIIYASTAQAFALNWDERRSTYWEQLASQEFRRVINLDKRRWLTGVTHIPYYTGAAGPNQRSFRSGGGVWNVPDDLDVSSG